MTAPARLTLSRAKGFNLKAASLALNGLPCLNVTRQGVDHGLFGNPFMVGTDGTREQCVYLYECMLAGHLALGKSVVPAFQERARAHVFANLANLRGRNLACACKPDGKPCHADVLLRLANAPVCEEVKG
jgi:hypothetical protein